MRSFLLTLALSCSGLAAFEGFYVGGSIGGHLTEGSQTGLSTSTLNILSPNQILASSSNLREKLFDHDVTGILFAGYGIRCCQLYLAAEGFLQFSPTRFKARGYVNEISSRIEQIDNATSICEGINTHQWGIDFLPGWYLNCSTLLYGRLGLSTARWHLKAGTEFQFDNVFDSGEVSVMSSKKKDFISFRAGLGIEKRLTRRLSLRADYIYTDYGKISVNGSVSTLSPVNLSPIFVSNKTAIRCYDHALMLGLCYRFNCLRPACLEPPPCSLAFQGLYCGGSIGGGVLEDCQRGLLQADNDFWGETRFLNTPNQSYNNQFQGALFLGYGEVWRRLYLGGELSVSTATNTSVEFAAGPTFINTPVGGASNTLNIFYDTSYDTLVEASTWPYSLDLRPGVLLTPRTLFYGRVGISAAKIKVDSHAVDSGFIIVAPTSQWILPEHTSKDKWNPALRLGIGIEYQLCSRLHLRADYVHTNLGRVSINDTSLGTDTQGHPITLSNTLRSRLRNNSVVIGLSYYFH